MNEDTHSDPVERHRWAYFALRMLRPLTQVMYFFAVIVFLMSLILLPGIFKLTAIIYPLILLGVWWVISVSIRALLTVAFFSHFSLKGMIYVVLWLGAVALVGITWNDKHNILATVAVLCFISTFVAIYLNVRDKEPV